MIWSWMAGAGSLKILMDITAEKELAKELSVNNIPICTNAKKH